MISEENDEPIIVNEHKDARYIVTFDPLDGSSNIDAGVNTGTIFGIFKRDDCEDVVSMAKQGKGLVDCLKKGSNMVVAGYCMYGPSTEMVMTTGKEVNGYTLDPVT